jgi:hypothetical protein
MVDLGAQISVLRSIWPTTEMRWVFNGTELNETLTFEFYGIREWDPIIAIPIDRGDSVAITNRWISLTRDSDVVLESIRAASDPKTCGEVARLRDLRLSRGEARPKRTVKILEDYFCPIGTTASCAGTETSWEPPAEPSVKALPVLWGKRQDRKD